jgi:5-methylcytosine-specific restriction endonuclease McrA
MQTPTLKIFHLKVEYDSKNDTLIYHRTLTPGAGTTYYGLEVAKALHIPESVLTYAHEIRRQLMNEADITKVKGSSWNSDKVKLVCEVCNCLIKSTLEVHHIQERAERISTNANKDGTGLHDLRNLVTVCQECHDKHHANEIEIKHVLQTTKGAKRDVSTANSKQKQQKQEKTPKFTDEQILTIRTFVKNNPCLKPSFLVVKLQTDVNIDLKVSELKKLLL